LFGKGRVGELLLSSTSLQISLAFRRVLGYGKGMENVMQEPLDSAATLSALGERRSPFPYEGLLLSELLAKQDLKGTVSFSETVEKGKEPCNGRD
jgi:hypothetical protein